MLCMIFSLSAASVDYMVSGVGLDKYNGKKFLLRTLSLEKNNAMDSVVVKDGKFVLRGTLEAPRLCTLYAADPRLPLQAKIPGHEELNKKYTEYSQATITPERRAELERELNEVQERQRALLKNFALAHCDNVVGAYFFSQSYTYFTKDELKQLYARMIKEFSNDPLAARPLSTLMAASLRETGRAYTDFAMADTTGIMHRLSDYVGEGRYVLLDFWASWCGPCRAEMPNVKKLYAKYHDRGFDVVGVSLDNHRESWLKAINQMGLPWHQLSDLKGWNSEASNLYGVDGIPCTILIGPDGTIIGNNLRGEALAETLAKLFP